jgi:Zn-dependent peptidase ImmA (M78 family)
MQTIPKQTRAYWVLRKARIFIQETYINWLPVDPFEIYKHYEWGLYSCSEVEMIYKQKDPFSILREGIDAKTYKDSKGTYITIYNETMSLERIRWTLAHEIGHIYLRHLIDFAETNVLKGLTLDQYKVLEREAHIFASELLAPIAVLKLIGATKSSSIMEVCYISQEAADNRARDIIRHGIKKVYTESFVPLLQQFEIFIEATNEVKRVNKFLNEVAVGSDPFR